MENPIFSLKVSSDTVHYITSSGHFVTIENFLKIPEIEKVIFRPPRTIILWKDHTKTVVKCGDSETFTKEQGFSAAVLKKLFGTHNGYKKIIESADVQEVEEE